jgi:hypothetical protein
VWLEERAFAHPLYKRLREAVDRGQVDLESYGHVPKNPKPAWWVQRAIKIYGREVTTEETGAGWERHQERDRI